MNKSLHFNVEKYINHFLYGVCLCDLRLLFPILS